MDDVFGFAKDLAKVGAKVGSVAIASLTVKQAVKSGTKPVVKITAKGLAHVVERHTVNGIPQFVKKSKFLQNVNIPSSIQKTNQVNPIPQASGRLAWIVNAGTNIGVDRMTGQVTQIYTVITEGTGELVTAFPGLP